MADTINCGKFGQFLVDQQPKYAEEILRAIRPTDDWIAHVDIGQFPAYSGVSMYKDRMQHVFPNTAAAWTQKSYTSCVGTPCKKTENQIGWGSSRLQFFLEEQHWATPVLCLEEDMHVTHAEQQYRQIIEDILTPATSAIRSMFMRKRALYWADKKWVAGTNFSTSAGQFSYIWQNDADGNEVYLLTSAKPTSKLTPQMLQRRVGPLMRIGYGGKSPYTDKTSPPLIELVTSEETNWELTHAGGQTGFGTNSNVPGVAANWRFTNWDAANEYWRYGFTGSIGNYATRVDQFELRFNYIGASGNSTYPYKFQLILPYTNVVSSGAGGAAGLMSVDNPNYELAQYRMSFIWHKKAMKALTMQPVTIGEEFPYMKQNFAGKWRAVLPHVCVQPDGTVAAVDNRRGNLVQFISDHELAIEPGRTEWAEAIFHKGEPACVLAVDTCNTEPGSTSESYRSALTACP